MNRTIGLVVLAVGLVVMLGGLGWAWQQHQQEDRNNDTPGPFNNPDESSENAGTAMQALWVAATGFVLACVGLVLTVMARRRGSTA